MSVLNHEVLFEKYFEEISAIPRESGNEGGMVLYFQSFAQEHGLKFYTDDLKNVILYKEGSAGYEDAPTVILQAHSDMVCVKNPGVVHNFKKDPIELVLEDNVLHANGTSLGADDGAGVATILALLADENCIHPPIEALFTACEETGMDGAANLDYSKLKGRRLISMDSGGENYSSVCAAACESVEMTRPINRTRTFGTVFTLEIKGLKGGHSGACIDMERGNAIKIAVALLQEYMNAGINLCIVSFESGTVTNAIPSECTVEFLCASTDAVEKLTHDFVSELYAETKYDEPEMKVILQETGKNVVTTDQETTRNIIDFLSILPSGRRHKSTRIENFVTASSNVAMVHMDERSCTVSLSLRAETELKRRELRGEISTIARLLGFAERTTSRTPCWVYNENSVLRKCAAKLAPEYLGNPLVEEFEHGGLECGYFADRIPGVDIYVIGPIGQEVHSTKEWMDLDSARRVYTFMLNFLEQLKD